MARDRQEPPAWWPTILPLALILASEYKLRSRSGNEAIGGGVDATILIEIGVYGLIAVYLYRRFGLRPPRRRAPYVLLLAWVFAAYLALSALWSIFSQFAVVRAAQLLVTLMVCQVLATRARRVDFHRFAHAFLVLLVISVAIGVAIPFRRTPQTVDRFNWLYVHPVSAGIFLGVGILLALSFALSRGLPRSWPRTVYFALLVILAAALVATGTRGAAGGCLAGAVVLLLTARGARGRVEFLMVALPAAAVVGLAFTDNLLAFATRGESAEQLESLNARTDLWTFALDAFAQRPIFGQGLSATRGLFLDSIGLGGGHNAFVNVLVEGGMVGLALFGSLLVSIITCAIALTRLPAPRPEAALLLSLMVFFLIDGLTAEMVAAPANVASVWLYVIVAWVCVLRGKPVINGARLPNARESAAHAD